MEGRSRLAVLVVIGLAGSAVVAPAAAPPPLRRTLTAYGIFAVRSLSLQNLQLASPGNVGVDCASPSRNAQCGAASFAAVTFPGGSQVVADKTFFNKPGATIGQLFRNGGGPLDNVTILQPPPQPFTPPIIPGTCDAQCRPNLAALEAECGFPSPFPACKPGSDVAVSPGGDCAGAPDAVPGNGRCDLGPGSYGDVAVRNLASLRLVGGTYDVCNLKLGRSGTVDTAAPAVVNIADQGVLNVNNQSQFGGTNAADLVVHLAGAGGVTLGKSSTVSALVCAPESKIFLGHVNTLSGQFVGDTIAADPGNVMTPLPPPLPCVCFDTFMPKTARVGDAIMLSGHCDLLPTTEVHICGIAAPITTQTSDKLTVTVPAGASGACTVEAVSGPGTFVGMMKLMVTP